MACGWARRHMVCADWLTDEELRRLHGHLRQCPACAHRWQQWEKLRSALAHLPAVTPPPSAKAGLLADLRALPRYTVAEWDCATARRALWQWLDGDLSTVDRYSFIAHVAECDACQSVLWASGRTLALLAQLPPVHAPAEDREALKWRLRATVSRPAWTLWRYLIPAAAALALGLGGLWLRATLQPGSPRARTIVRAPTLHQTQPPPHTVKPTLPRGNTTQPGTLRQRPHPVAPRPLRTMLATRPTPPQPAIAPRRLRRAAGKQPPWRIVVAAPKAETQPSDRIATSLPQPEGAFRPTEATHLEPSPQTPQNQTPSATPPPSSQVERPVLTVPPISSTDTMSQLVTAVPQVAAPQTSPHLATPAAPQRQLTVLPAVTIQRDIPLAPPRVRLSALPPSQRLYQRSGVAFLKVDDDKRPSVPPENPVLSSTMSIPMAAERYRSRTAVVPLTGLGVSW
ncbi:hypothetical protein HRbin17_00923 [bacterium HR17]|uniref:Putative zinc-finger domain-containing protein n=1 Tax=Candidatus Fervidibacter japonicus TaxID=2035412 RepID=A0A2H5XB41_9BACT|nr:hypothetical protein HRbin17_00923 [bacterium HR17]